MHLRPFFLGQHCQKSKQAKWLPSLIILLVGCLFFPLSVQGFDKKSCTERILQKILQDSVLTLASTKMIKTNCYRFITGDDVAFSEMISNQLDEICRSLREKSKGPRKVGPLQISEKQGNEKWDDSMCQVPKRKSRIQSEQIYHETTMMEVQSQDYKLEAAPPSPRG